MYNASHDVKTSQNKMTINPTFQAELKTIKRFIADEVVPHEHLLLTQQWDELEHVLTNLRKKVKHHNWWSTHFPTNMDSPSMYMTGLLSEVVGQSPLGHYVFGMQAPDIGNVELLHDHASDEIKQQWLNPLMNGDIRSCFAMTEPDNAGSNPTLLSTTATSSGDDWLITGRKWFTTSAEGAAFTIVMAVTNPEAEKHNRASMIVVPMDNEGLQFKRNIPIMGHSGSGYFSHAELEFNQCRVPKSNTIGPVGAGFKLAQHRLGPGRIHHCMRWIGIAQRCFDIWRLWKNVALLHVMPVAMATADAGLTNMSCTSILPLAQAHARRVAIEVATGLCLKMRRGETSQKRAGKVSRVRRG